MSRTLGQIKQEKKISLPSKKDHISDSKDSAFVFFKSVKDQKLKDRKLKEPSKARSSRILITNFL